MYKFEKEFLFLNGEHPVRDLVCAVSRGPNMALQSGKERSFIPDVRALRSEQFGQYQSSELGGSRACVQIWF